MFGSRLALIAVIALGATACGDSSSTSATPVPPTITVVPNSFVATTLPLTPTTSTTSAPAPTTAAPTPTTIAPSPQPCAAAAMSLTERPSDGAMGTIYTPLLLVNAGATACTVSTHVVLTFLDSGGQTVGASIATSEANGPGLITLAPAESRQTVLSYGQPGNLDCPPIDTPTTAQLIFNQTEKLTLPPEVWPLCPDRLADQVSLGDLEAPTP